MIQNLFTNAIKFTRKGKIKVSGKVYPKHDHPEECVLKVSVSDEGCGMQEHELESVFDGKLDNTRNLESKRLNPYGNGIGLALCKEICQGLDGSISATSVFGEGSTFTFTMKVLRMYQDEPEEESHPELADGQDIHRGMSEN